MSQSEDHFESADGLRLFQSVWRPRGECEGVVALLHGFTEHSGRYAALAAALNEHGYVVHAMDLRGHGRSEGDRVFIRSYDEHLEDVRAYLECVARREPDKPLFLVGHSMGGQILTLLAIAGSLEAAGLVLSAPPIKVDSDVFPLLRYLAPLLGRLLPRLRLVRMGAKGLSRDPRVVAQFESDPLVYHGRFPAGTGAEILRAVGRIKTRMELVRLPLLILQGTGDLVVDPAGGQQLYDGAGSEDKTLRLYEGLYHDLFHEPERAQVIRDLVAWLNVRKHPPRARVESYKD